MFFSSFGSLAPSMMPAAQLGSQIGSQVLQQGATPALSNFLNQGLMEVAKNAGQSVAGQLGTQVGNLLANQTGTQALSPLARITQASQQVLGNALSNNANAATQGIMSKAWDWLTKPTTQGYTTKIGVDQFGNQVITQVPIEGASRLGTFMNAATTAGDLLTKYQQYKDSKRNNELAYQSNKYGFDRTKSENSRLDRQRANITSSYQNGAVI